MKFKRSLLSAGVILSAAFMMLTMTPISFAADKAEAPAKAAATVKAPKYVASSQSKIYHLASCGLAAKIKPENLVKFSTKAEAKKAGYEPCKVCLKEK